MTATADRVSWGAGIVAPVVTLGAIFVATLLSPQFSWTGNALSNLGTTISTASTPTTRLVFNGGLIAGGFVGLWFGYALVGAARNRIELVGVALFGLVLVALVLIGVFPQGTDPHVPVAIAFYVLLSIALWTYGVGNVVAGDRVRGVATILAGGLNGATWAVWIATGALLRPGLALPEIVGAVLFAGWAVGTSLDVRARLGSDPAAGP
ncbi:DUF998 domain-containing protein [Halorientalis brevis]|uniref:DUF998 domain-containing protein n=1 Tax=Halorientalis brevis TaxID=1126241 RepID=A0ABD6CCQ7_9EURY|nr:DUF998 domain-containing protein [Halorientalis brevis]